MPSHGITASPIPGGGIGGGGSLLRIVSNKKIMEVEANAKREEERQNTEPLTTQLTRHIEHVWQENLRHKQTAQGRRFSIEKEMIMSLRQRDNEYEPDKLDEIRQTGGSEVFIGITDTKCSGGEAWITDILSSEIEKPWELRPTPEPELPDEVEDQIISETMATWERLLEEGTKMTEEQVFEFSSKLREDMDAKIQDEAKDRAVRMDRKIWDQMLQGGWIAAFERFLIDLMTLKAGFIKGPIIRKKKVKKWVKTRGGRTVIKIKKEIRMEFEAPSPFDMYPSPNAVDINDGNLIERLRFERKNLLEMKGVEGYIDEAIDLVLARHSLGLFQNLTTIDRERFDLEKRGDRTETRIDSIDGLEFWGSVSGIMLIEHGITEDLDGNDIEPLTEYEINAIKIGHILIFVTFNPDPLGKRPYSKTGYRVIPGSFWFKGVPDLMRDLQNASNASVRHLLNNLAISSGPQVVIEDINRLPPGEPITKIFPWKVWQLQNPNQSTLPGIRFDQPNSNAGELLGVFRSFRDMADEYTGIPAFAHGQGQNIRGAGRALANYEEVLTPDGPIEMGDLKVGDKVVNSYGSASKVIEVYPQGQRDIFRMKFSDKTHIDCDLEHQWAVSYHPEREKWQVYTTAELLKKGLYRDTKKDERNPKGYRPKWALPPVKSIHFTARKVNIDSYTMGALLGDGDSRCRITSMDDEIFERIPYELGVIDNKNEENRAISRTIKGIKQYYHAYGMNCRAPEKFIPDDYLYNSKDVRLELLRGLMDTDGCATTDGEKTFYQTTSERLAKDFMALILSLGATGVRSNIVKAHQSYIQGRHVWSMRGIRIIFNMANEDIFHLSRKLDLVKPRTEQRRYITGIEYIGHEEATCITVDSKDSLFICANYVPTHNTLGGLTLLMGTAARGIKHVIARIHEQVVKTTIERIHEWNMLYDPDESLKGDVEIRPIGILGLIIKEQMTLRRQEFLNSTNNPIDLQITGLEGRANVLREQVKGLDIPESKAIKSEDAIRDIESSAEVDAEEQRQLALQQQAVEAQQPQGAAV